MLLQNRWLFLIFALLLPISVQTQGHTPLLRNGGFEGGISDGSKSNVPGWEPFEAGYRPDRQTIRRGEQSIRCDSLTATSLRGARTILTLNQTQPIPLVISGWSKADAVSGVSDSDYAIYIDLEYTDGTPLWGLAAPFGTGTHDWERRQILVQPIKPIKTLSLYALFRRHSGTAWFDDFSARELRGKEIFDSQEMPHPNRPPSLPAGEKNTRITARDGLALGFTSDGDIAEVLSGAQSVSAKTAGGFWVRDVAANGAPVPMRGALRRLGAGGLRLDSPRNAAHVRFTAKIVPENDGLAVDGELTDTTRGDRAVTVYLALPVQAEGWQWGQDIRHSQIMGNEQEFTHQVSVNVGATGGMSLYPFGCISNSRNGIGISSQMDWPSVYRIFYNGASRQFVIAWDFALTSKSAAWPSHNARFRCTLFRLPPSQAAWGFRAAAQRFYRLHSGYFQRRAKAEGIWIPFTDPAIVPHASDFGFAYHEGDNSLKTDDERGILSFRYTEPMSFWMNMPPDMPRTYENALSHLNRLAAGKAGVAGSGPAPAKAREEQEAARATLQSGTQDERGRYNLTFRNEPWANGAVFVLNPNPELPATPEKPTKASISYSLTMAAKMYGKGADQARGVQDGEYLDSLESWGEVLDFRPSNLAACPYPLTFDTDNRRPVLPQWFSTHTFARFLSNDLHSRGKLLMANTTPVHYSIFAPLMDVMGIEVNWLDAAGKWSPESDAVLNLRRTMSGQKPYLLLLNTDFERFGPPLVEKYFQRSLFYGIYPSMFSVDAASNPYWDNPRWYNRDRPLFVKYIPIIKTLSAAGWEPIPYARTSHPMVSVERFGTRHFTVLNDSSAPQTITLTLDLHTLKIPTSGLRVRNLLTNQTLPAIVTGGNLSLSLSFAPEEVLALSVE